MEKITIKVKPHANPKLAEFERIFEFARVETDLVNFAKIEGFFKLVDKDEGDLSGLNVNGTHASFTADHTTKVDSATGQYNVDGDMTEIDYLQQMPISVIAKDLQLSAEIVTALEKVPTFNLKSIFEYLIIGTLIKQGEL